MRVMGHNLLAILVAAILFYAIEFVMFAVVIPGEQYARMVGISYDAAGDMSKMAYGVIMPIMAVIGISLVVKWRGAVGAAGGAVTAVLMGVLMAFSASLYGWVYGGNTADFIPVSFLHYVLCYGVAGAVLGAWK